MSTKYRKKPVVIDAFQFTKATEREALAFVNDKHYAKPMAALAFIDRKGRLLIKTLEGDMRADHGDWIIRGVQEEYYPCKPDIFEQTYEAV